MKKSHSHIDDKDLIEQLRTQIAILSEGWKSTKELHGVKIFFEKEYKRDDALFDSVHDVLAAIEKKYCSEVDQSGTVTVTLTYNHDPDSARNR